MVASLKDRFAGPSKPKEDTPVACRHRAEASTERCEDCKAEKAAATKYRWKVILSLMWPFALQALDATIIASALPWIASDFGEISQLNWIVSAFNLTSATFIPCWAQMADVFGRNAALNGAIVIMVIGSALCTGAPTSAFAMLLLGRALQGVAAAGLSVVVRTILSDRVTLQENAKNWATFSFVGGISYALGPVIGGYLADSDWRWCFAINLPVAAVALLVLLVVLRKELLGPQPIPELDETAETGRRTKFLVRLKTIDVGGQLLFLVGFGLIILGLTWGGVTYPWNSVPVLLPLVLGCVIVGCFFYWERMMAPGRALATRMPWQRPMIPWAILTNRDVGIIFFSESMSGMALYAVLYFCNIYFIAVKHYTSDEAGVQLLYFTPGLGGGVFLCSFLCNVWPKMTFPPLFIGSTIETIGLGVIAWAMSSEQKQMVYGMMAFIGVGMGLRFMAAPIHGIGIFKNSRAALIGLMALAVPFGGTIGLTIMSTVMNNTSGLDSGADFSKIQDLPADARTIATQSAKMGVVWAYVAITPLVAAGWLALIFVGNVKLGVNPDTGEGENVVTEVPFLWAVMTGRSRAQGGVDVEGGVVEATPKLDRQGVELDQMAKPASAQGTMSERPLLN